MSLQDGTLADKHSDAAAAALSFFGAELANDAVAAE
jgi:hypothetical protein